MIDALTHLVSPRNGTPLRPEFPPITLRAPFAAALIAATCCVALISGASHAAAAPFKTYTDPKGRFSFAYPGAMTIRRDDEDRVIVHHPQATLRISVFVENRLHKGSAEAAPFLSALKAQLAKERSKVKILEEGRLPGQSARQGYLICYYEDKKGGRLVQLVHYHVTDRRILQMVISDRPKGFQALRKVIRKVHRSLKVKDYAL